MPVRRLRWVLAATAAVAAGCSVPNTVDERIAQVPAFESTLTTVCEDATR